MGRVIPWLVSLFVLGIGVAVWLHIQDQPNSRNSESTPTSSVIRQPGSPAFAAARQTLDRLPVRHLLRAEPRAA